MKYNKAVAGIPWLWVLQKHSSAETPNGAVIAAGAVVTRDVPPCTDRGRSADPAAARPAQPRAGAGTRG